MSIAHRLRHRVTIEQLATTRDEFGGVVESWGTVAIVPAEVWPLSGREFVAAQAEQAGVTTRITVRYQAGIEPAMRVARIQRVSNRMTPVTGRVARLPDLAERKCYPRTMTSEEGSTQPPTLTENDLVFIREAARFFEDPGLIVKGMNLIGQPLETFQKKLPRKVQTAMAKASRKAIEQALVLSTKTIPSAPTAANS